MYSLYKKVFGNVVLSKKIFSYCRLYIKNIFITFEKIQSLIEYQEREYIESLYFHEPDYLLRAGDLPIGGVLKNLTINSFSSLESGESIPYGVESITLVKSHDGSFQLASLPSTVYSIKNLSLSKPEYRSNLVFVVPSTIKSISLESFDEWSISKKAKINFIQLPDTLEKLKLGEDCDNQRLPIKKGDLPSGLKKLVIENYELEYSNDAFPPNGLIELKLNCYLNNFKELILPITLKFLKISLNSKEDEDEDEDEDRDRDRYEDEYERGEIIRNEIFNKLPSKLEELHILFNMFVSKISKKSKLSKCKSIKKLTIEYENANNTIFQPKSLPSSVTDLSLINIANGPFTKFPFPKKTKKLLLIIKSITWLENENILFKKSLPNSITSLAINFINDEKGCFPSSLTHFQLLKNDFDLIAGGPNIEALQGMLSKLPKSLIYLDLPTYCESLNLNVKSNIILNYKD
ncbi:hypothetical protein ACTFIR_000085 [Dictyostelium discoideum]